jgi:hypothetical protein
LLAVARWELSLAWHFIRFAGRLAFEILCQAAVFVKYQARISRAALAAPQLVSADAVNTSSTIS